MAAKKKESAFDIEDDDFDSMFESSLGFAEESESEPADLKKPEPEAQPEPVAEPKPTPEPEPVAAEPEPAPQPEPEPESAAAEPVVPEATAEAVESIIGESVETAQDVVIVSPLAPVEGSEDNVIRIPSVDGVEYVIGDDAYVGDVEVPESGLTIFAYPLEGYALDDTVSIEWSFDFIPPPPQKTEVAEPSVPATATEPTPPQAPVGTDISATANDVSVDDTVSELPDDTSGGFDPNASQAENLKSGIDKDVSLETLEESIKILDAYRSLEDDEAQFSGLFIGLDPEATEAEVVSTVMNADPLLMEVFASIKEAKTYDDTEVAFYVVGLKWEVLEGISYVASQYLDTDVADQGDRSKIPYAREIVGQVKKLDTKALRLVESAESLISGEVRDKDADLSH